MLFRMLILMMITVCSNAVADEQLIKAPLKIGIGYQARPFFFGFDKGIEVDIVSTILNRLQLKHRYFSFSLNRVRRSLETVGMDISLSAIHHQRRKDCSAPYLYYNNVAISLTENKIKLDVVDDFKHHSVYTWQGANKVLGSEFFSIFPQVGNGYNELAQAEKLPLLLWKKRSDVIVIDKFIFQYLWNELRKTKVSLPSITYHPLFPRRVYYCARFKDALIKDAFNRELKLLKQQKGIEAIYKKYIPSITDDDVSWR